MKKAKTTAKPAPARSTDGAPSLERALRYRWRDPEHGFADARERDPRKSAVGILLTDGALSGGMAVAYWFTSLEQLIAWSVRVVLPSEGMDEESEDDAELTNAQYERKLIGRLVRAVGPKRRLGPVTRWLDAHMSGTSVAWSGTFEELCTRPSGRELRQGFRRAQTDDCPPASAPIPSGERAAFVEWLQAMND